MLIEQQSGFFEIRSDIFDFSFLLFTALRIALKLLPVPEAKIQIFNGIFVKYAK